MTAMLLVAAIEAARQLGGDAVAALVVPGHRAWRQGDLRHGHHRRRHLPGAHLSTLVGSSTGEAGFAQTIVKYAIIALFTAIGLTFMGLADQIVMMAFGLILGSAAVATAIAFGLGGRDAAARDPRAMG